MWYAVVCQKWNKKLYPTFSSSCYKICIRNTLIRYVTKKKRGEHVSSETGESNKRKLGKAKVLILVIVIIILHAWMQANKTWHITYSGLWTGQPAAHVCVFCNCRLENTYVHFCNSDSGHLWYAFVICNKTFFLPFIFISPRLLQNWYIFYAVRWNMNMIRSCTKCCMKQTWNLYSFLKLKERFIT